MFVPSFTWGGGSFLVSKSGNGELDVGDNMTFYVETNNTWGGTFEPNKLEVGYDDTKGTVATGSVVMNLTSMSGNMTMDQAAQQIGVSSVGTISLKQSNPGTGANGGIVENVGGVTNDNGDVIVSSGTISRDIGDNGTNYVKIGMPIYLASTGTLSLGSSNSTNSGLMVSSDSKQTQTDHPTTDAIEALGTVKLIATAKLWRDRPGDTFDNMRGDVYITASTSQMSAEVTCQLSYVQYGGNLTIGSDGSMNNSLLHVTGSAADIEIHGGTVIVWVSGSGGGDVGLEADGNIKINPVQLDNANLSVHTVGTLRSPARATILDAGGTLIVNGWSHDNTTWNGTTWANENFDNTGKKWQIWN
jgi:hypothetical protein